MTSDEDGSSRKSKRKISGPYYASDHPAAPQQGYPHPSAGYQQGPPPEFQEGPPPGFEQVPPPGFEQVPPPGFEQVPPPGYQQGPPPGFEQGPPPGFQQGPPSGYQQGPPSGYQQEPPPGLERVPPPGFQQGFQQGPPPGYQRGFQGPPPGYQQGPPSGYQQGPPSGYQQEPPPQFLLRQPAQGHRRRGKRRGVVTAVIAGAVAIVAAIAAVIVFVVIRPGGNSNITGFVPTGSSPGQDAEQTTTAFLHAWQTGNLSQAARYTDHPSAAQAALVTYRKYLHLKKMTAVTQAGSAVPASASGTSTAPRETVKYEINATVTASDGGKTLSGAWSYHASLTAYQQPNSQVWYVAWQPDVLAPNLTAKTHLATVVAAPQIVSVTDVGGNALSTYGDAGLTNIANLLGKQAPPGQGSPGLNVEIQTAAGKTVPNSQAVVIAPTNIPTLNTTISAQAEAAARSAVSMRKNSSMVVIQPSTGKILAIANNAGFNDFALTAQVAPGSSMKVITSAALINAGALTANTPVACPATYTIQGITYHNDKNETLPAGTPFSTDFAQSCNNAFSQQWQHLSGGGLANTAKKYFGLNQKWNIGISGVSASYFNAPASASGSELAQEAFGEGQLTASPIAMASVAATVANGMFQQPYLVEGIKRVTATPLPASTGAQLKQMMRAVVTSGTAAGIGFGPTVYAKTGTADIQGQEQPNSWLIAFDPSKDVAVGCLVVNAGYGAQFAGPEVKAFLDSY